jgi:hypothetical protein
MAQVQGNNKIVFLQRAGEFIPVGCIISNSFEESSETLAAQTRELGIWTSIIPDLQSYSITVEAIQDLEIGGIITFEDIRGLKRAQYKVNWRIGIDGDFEQEGFGYITSVSEVAEVNQSATYNFVIQGDGVPLVVNTALGVDLTDFLEDGDGNLIDAG